MAYFAQLNENNVVIRVIAVDDNDTSDSNGVVSENIGIGSVVNVQLLGDTDIA